jgi:predicted TIM-barrel fold metal-dependent hydrolase
VFSLARIRIPSVVRKSLAASALAAVMGVLPYLLASAPLAAEERTGLDSPADQARLLANATPNSADSLPANATLARAMSERRIVNAHEHIQSAREAGKLRAVMDELGIGKTLLFGTSWFTITLDPRHGFTRYDQNNAAIMSLQNAEPERFEAWPTLDPRDPEKLAKIRRLVAQGAKGVKLYLGHGYIHKRPNAYLFHSMAMDDPRMMAFYAWCEANFVPIMYHVNPYKPGFAEEFIAVLRRFPDLKVIAPHFILSSIKSTRLREFLDTFPNLTSDVSFGHDDFLVKGLKRISRKPGKFKKLFRDYPDRFMFGTDLVVTEHPRKSAAWMGERVRAYLNMLAAETYEVDFLPGERLKGLALSGEALERILYRNYEDFMAARPRGTRITRTIDWSRMGVAKTGRKPGTTIPPPPAGAQ